MDFAHQPLFEMLSQRLNWLTSRQKVISQNIANVDTPAYQERDLKKLSFAQMVNGQSATLPMAQTNAKDISTQTGSGLGANDTFKPKPIETTLSGNSVTLDAELMKLQETAQDHTLALNLYHDQLAMFRTVLGAGGGGG
jgi:flagellar basal-body rod protein FlgB